MTATEFHEWIVFYQLEKEDTKAEVAAEIEEAKRKAKEEAGNA